MSPPDELDAWEMNELLTLIKKCPSYTTKTNSASKKDLRKSLDDMILCGKVIVDKDIRDFLEEERIAREKLREFEDADPEGEEKKEEERLPIERFFDEITEDKNGEYSVKSFLEDVKNGVGGVPPPKWRCVTHAEAKYKAKDLYKKAAQLQQRVALMGDNDAKMVRENTLAIKELTTYASRLEKIAEIGNSAELKYNKTLGPRKVMRGDSVSVKTMMEKVKAVDWDEGLSDDEEEGKTEEDTEEIWSEKKRIRENLRADKNRLKNKFGLNEDVQGRYRQVLHTRRPKDITVKQARMVTNFSVFDR